MSEEKKVNENNQENENSNPSTSRRNVIKALAGIPILGAFGLSAFKSKAHKERKKQDLSRQLGLDELNSSVPDSPRGNNNDLLRIGIIGFGTRAHALARGLGYIHPQDAKNMNDSRLESWLNQKDLNVAITGVCEVFELRAKEGMEIAQHELHPGNASHHKLGVKRYLNYKDMLADKDIDAVVIATPDHWHATMTMDAINAGKHVYCEKCLTRTEQETYDVYDTIKNSDRVFQLGHQITKNSTFQQARKIIDKKMLGDISMVETNTNRNTANGAWIRHLDENGNLKPGSEKLIDWEQWQGSAEKVPFSVDRYYNWTKWFDYGRGLLSQLFSHEFDAINQLLDLDIPERVMASGGIYFWKDNREMPDMLHGVFEYPKRGFTMIYSGNLGSSFNRSRKIMGRDATMELGSSLKMTADRDSKRYKSMIDAGTIDTSAPMINLDPSSENIDAVTSATEMYYASRGLTYTMNNGRRVDVTHLHLAEWVDCIRNGGVPAANIEKSFVECVTIQMAHKSYLERRAVSWDPVKRRIV